MHKSNKGEWSGGISREDIREVHNTTAAKSDKPVRNMLQMRLLNEHNISSST